MQKQQMKLALLKRVAELLCILDIVIKTLHREAWHPYGLYFHWKNVSDTIKRQLITEIGIEKVYALFVLEIDFLKYLFLKNR